MGPTFSGWASYPGRVFWNCFLDAVLFHPCADDAVIGGEKKTGTIEMLLTKAVTDWEVVIGKFLSIFLLVGIALAFTLPYVITLANIGDLDLAR